MGKTRDNSHSTSIFFGTFAQVEVGSSVWVYLHILIQEYFCTNCNSDISSIVLALKELLDSPGTSLLLIEN